MSTKRQTTQQKWKIGSSGIQRHQEHAAGPNEPWTVRDGRSQMATSSPRPPCLKLQSGQSFKGEDLIGGREGNIFNSSRVSVSFWRFLGVIYRALFGLVLVKKKKKRVTTSVRWVGSRECPGAEWGHPKRPLRCQLRGQTLGPPQCRQQLSGSESGSWPWSSCFPKRQPHAQTQVLFNRHAHSDVDRPALFSHVSLLSKTILREAGFFIAIIGRNSGQGQRHPARWVVSPTRSCKPV